MTDDEWKTALIDHMTKHGWTLDRDDETHLGFTCDGWIRDYNKKKRNFVHYNGKQIVDIKVSPHNEDKPSPS